MREPQTHPAAFPAATPRPLVGTTELSVAEAATGGGSRPQRVTAVLAATYATLADEPASPEIARRLCAGAREWLLQRAAHRLRPGVEWFESRCGACGEPFDLSLSLADAGRSRGAGGFPEVEVRTSLGKRRFEAPCGHHEEAWAGRRQDAAVDPRRFFAAVCGLSDDAAAEAERFDEDDLERIDQALEEVSPDVADSVRSTCPTCGEPTRSRLDPLTFGFPDTLGILREVNAIAGRYGWSEERILALPAHRRSTYAALIGESRRPTGGRWS